MASGEVLEAERVLRQAGDRQDANDRSPRHDELLVDELLLGCDHAAEQQLGVRAHLPYRHDGVPRLQRARGGLGEHGL